MDLSKGASGVLSYKILKSNHLMGADQRPKFKCPRTRYKAIISSVNGFRSDFPGYKCHILGFLALLLLNYPELERLKRFPNDYQAKGFALQFGA